MKSCSIFLALLVSSSIVIAQTKKPVTKPPVKSPATKTGAVVLKNELDSFSYAVGMSTAFQFKDYGVTKLNAAAVNAGITDVLNGKTPAFSGDQAGMVLNMYINKLMSARAEVNKKAGAEFLAKNKSKPGIVTLASGLQYQVLREGNGRKPLATDTVTVHYTGTLMDGTVFDSSIGRDALKIRLSDVIPGWTEAFQLMPIGSRWKLFIPGDLAYGNFPPPGSPIQPGSLLIFDVDLLDASGK